jgi:deoxyribonuclease-4
MTSSSLLLGAHCIGTGGIAMAARRAGRSGMQALQVFSAVPKFYNDKTSVKPERVASFRAALDDAGIDPANVVVHAGYVLNCATPDEGKWARAAAGLAKEFERSTLLGVGGVCFHPGAATDGDREGAITRVTEAMRRALLAVPEGPTRLLIENTAGAGTTMGRTPEEIAGMLDGLPDELRARAGYGLDTCHLYASGYDLAASRAEVTRILDAFEAAIGEAPAFLHLNDSQGALASNKDRHARIGAGEIGAEAFGWLLQDPRARGIPCIMETPQAVPDVATDDDAADPWDVEDLATLRALAAAE